MTLSATSIFSGAGGLDAGAIGAGVKISFAIECDPSAALTQASNLRAPVACADARSLPFPHDLPQPDILLAGPPCQPFSNAGRHRTDDHRAPLLLTVIAAAVLLNPPAVIVENVPAVKRGPGAPLWSALRNRLRSQGYRTREMEVDAAEYGVAQRRKRLFLVALQGLDPAIPGPTTPIPSTLSEALANAILLSDHRPRHLDGASANGQIAKHIGAGQKLSNVRAGLRNVHTWQIPEIFGHVSPSAVGVLEALLVLRRRDRVRPTGDGDPVPARRLAAYLARPVSRDLTALSRRDYIRASDGGYVIRSTFNGKYRRLQWDEPSPTVHTSFGDPRYFLHPDEQRGFTVREAALLQGFQGGYSFIGTRRDQFRQIGNAVPPPVVGAVIAANTASIARWPGRSP